MSRASLVVTLLACGLSLHAQSWDALRGLGPGDRIKVVDTTHQEHVGGFTAFSERGISIETRRGVVEIERARVRRVEVRASSRRVRNILIGAGIALAVTYIAPIALFAGIGAALSPYRTIYRAR